MAYPWQSNTHAMHTVRYMPPMANPYGSAYAGPPGQGPDVGDLVSSTVGGAVTGGMALSFIPGVGTAIGATAGALIGAGSSIFSQWYKIKRGLMARGLDHFYNRAMETSVHNLQSPRGFATVAAHSMRQNMLMAMHNSAYSVRAAMGNEAAILHR